MSGTYKPSEVCLLLFHLLVNPANPSARRSQAGRYPRQACLLRARLRWIVSHLTPPSPSLPSYNISLFSHLPLILASGLSADQCSDGPDPHVEGAKGGKASGSSDGETYKPSEHGGLKKDGTEDKRVSSEHGFGGS